MTFKKWSGKKLWVISFIMIGITICAWGELASGSEQLKEWLVKNSFITRSIPERFNLLQEEYRKNLKNPIYAESMTDFQREVDIHLAHVHMKNSDMKVFMEKFGRRKFPIKILVADSVKITVTMDFDQCSFFTMIDKLCRTNGLTAFYHAREIYIFSAK